MHMVQSARLPPVASFLRPPGTGCHFFRAFLSRVTGRPLSGQFALDERQQLLQRLEVRGVAADDVLGSSAERSVRPRRFAGQLHDKGAARCKTDGTPSGGTRNSGRALITHMPLPRVICCVGVAAWEAGVEKIANRGR